MTVHELIQELLKLPPEAEVVMGIWNGHTRTYTVHDKVIPLEYEGVQNDFFGTPGEIDPRMLKIQSEMVAFLGTDFDRNDKIQKDRSVMCELIRILDSHRSWQEKSQKIIEIIHQYENEAW